MAGKNKRPDPNNPAHQILLKLDGWDYSPHTGQFGSERDALFAGLNEQYGAGNWWFGWRMPDGKIWNFLEMFWKVYIEGYDRYFNEHPDEAEYLAEHYSYAYDLTEIPRQLAYDPTALVNMPGLPNQFHHVALNYVISARPGGWRGNKPIAVRGPGTEGERWNPGHIPAPPEYVDFTDESVERMSKAWWEHGSIEGVYQLRKTLVTRPDPHPEQEPHK